MLNHILELAQGETSSKVKKRKTSKDEKDMEQVMVAIQDVASTMRKGNLTFVNTGEKSLLHSLAWSECFLFSLIPTPIWRVCV
jgi:hypothetical protein